MTACRNLVGCLCLGFASGCFTAELDPTLSGVFACAGDVDCPGEMGCSNALCYAPEDLPAVQIQSPAPRELLDASVWTAAYRPLVINLTGTLELVEPGNEPEHVAGQGHLVVEVDGEEAAVIAAGGLDPGVPLSVEVRNTAGAHRIRVRARRNDGVFYDHEDAIATRLIWIDDGAPHVAIDSLWPGTALPNAEVALEISVATINFVLAGPGDASVAGRGHARLHYDDAFPPCALTLACDLDPLAIVGASGRATLKLPDRPAGTDVLTATLHPSNGSEGTLVYETISIERVSTR